MVPVFDLTYPFAGRWLVHNSPANRVPSHGTAAFATSHAIDFVPVDHTGRSARYTLGSLLRPEPAVGFVGFGRPLLAPAGGVVVSAHDAQPDHPAYRGLPSLRYALTQGQRAGAGWLALAGNHLMIETGEGIVVALCHLQRGSLGVRVGEYVSAGQAVGRCGNSGNSTEPHLHLQAMDSQDVHRAHAVPITFGGALPHNGETVEVP